MDIYLVTCPDQSEPISVLMDMYHAGYIEKRPIPGFEIASAEVKAAPVSATTQTTLNCKTSLQGNARVSGVIFEGLPALVPGVRLTFVSGQSCADTTTDGLGQYAISLAPGTYAVEAFLPGFCKGELTGIVIGEESRVRASISLAVSNEYQGPNASLSCPLNQETVPLRGSPEILVAHVFFGSKTVSDGNVEYRGQPVRALQATITLGTFIIRADSILIDSNRASVRARGRVLVSGTSDRERTGSSAHLDLNRTASQEAVDVSP